jgi:addiction module HigA family antidote
MSIRIEDLSRMDFSDVADVAAGKLPPIHPGEILLEDFLLPMGITQYRLAKEIGVAQRRIGQIVAGNRAVTPDTGLRLSRYFGLNDGFWVGLQTDYDLEMARAALGEVLARIRPVVQAA